MGFKASYSSAIIDPRALSFKNKYPQEYEKLIKKYKFSDLSISGMTIIYKK